MAYLTGEPGHIRVPVYFNREDGYPTVNTLHIETRIDFTSDTWKPTARLHLNAEDMQQQLEDMARNLTPGSYTVTVGDHAPFALTIPNES